MIASLNTGVSALNGFQRGMEVVGHNIANANTYGYKSQRMEYKDSFYETLNRSVSGGTGAVSTANQIGGGLQANIVTTNYMQGIVDSTSVDTDLAIEGKGFFRVLDETDPAVPQQLYTRAGNFQIDNNGYLTTAEGYFVQGRTLGEGSVNLQVTGTSDGQGSPADGFSLAEGDLGTGSFTVGQALALPADYNGGSGYLDSENAAPKVTIIGDGAGAEARAIVTDGVVTGIEITSAGSGYTNAVVRIEEPPASDLNYVMTAQPALGETGKIRITTPTFSLSGPEETSAISADNVAAQAPGMQTFSVLGDGTVQVVLDNGEKVTVGQVLLQDFLNPQALSHERGTYFSNFSNAATEINTFASADATPGTSGLGVLRQGALELSNANITDDFADLITSQRSFQGAARIITTSDEILREAVGLKR